MQVMYNGIILNRCITKNWEETVEYDSSGMNLIGSRIRLTFEGTIMPKHAMSPYSNLTDAQLAQIPYGVRRTARGHNGVHYANVPATRGEGTINAAIQLDTDGEAYYIGYPVEAETEYPTGQIHNFTSRLNVILRQLQIPRKMLIVTSDLTDEVVLCAFGSDEQVKSFALGGYGSYDQAKKHIDINGGPKPMSVSLTEIYNEFARVTFTVEVFRIRCLGGDIEGYLTNLPSKESNPADGFIVSNRCWTEETIDKNFYTTRVYSGRLRISSTEKSVHYYRHAYYPPLEPGFKRESVRFSESEDGLELSYVVTDKQTRISAPYPATEFSGTVRYSVENSSMVTLSLDLTLVGRPDADKSMLVERGMYAIITKINSFTTNSESNQMYGGFQKKFVVSENLGDPPSVSLSAVYTLYSDVAKKPADIAAGGVLQEQFLHGFDQIGRPVDFNNRDENGGIVYAEKHNRFRSSNPNPYGYAVFTAYDTEAPGEAAEAAEDSFLGYIKCLATTPCGFESWHVDSDSVYAESEVKNLTTTVVYQDAAGTQYTTAKATSEKEAVTYPFSFYKSDITYCTDYSRFVLPQALSVSGDPTSRSDIYSRIHALEDEIETLRQQLSSPSEPEPSEEEPSEEEPSAEEESAPAPTTEEIEAMIEVKETERDRLKKLLNNTMIVQLARPVPKAIVTIEAERFGRLPEFPDPNEVVSCEWDNEDEEPLYFTLLKTEIRLGEPRPGKNTTSTVSYNGVATYEYALSRDYKKGDRVWLLNNPTFGATSYFPRNQQGEIVPDGLSALFDGKGLSHGNLSNESEADGGSDGGSGGEPGENEPTGEEEQGN